MTDTTNLIKGIDISTIQGNVDFAAVAATGVQFVICRCGVGNGGKDALYDHNIAAAQAAGLKVAAYNFVYPLPPLASQPLRDPVKQAQLHAGWAGNVPVVCCDLEWPTPQDWAKWGCSAAQIVQWTITYLEAYEAASGVRPIVYTYPNFAQSIHLPPSFGQTYKLWIASYQATPYIPAPWTDWVLWQNSGGTQHLPNGVAVDTDYAKDLSLWDVAAPAPMIDMNVSVVDNTNPMPPVVVPNTTNPAPPVAPATPANPNFFLLIWQLLSGTFNKLFKR